MKKFKWGLAALVALAALFTACENAKKTTADSAIKGAQAAYGDIAEQANQFVPERAADVRGAIQTAQNDFNRGDYSAAFEDSRTLPVKVKELKDAAKAKRDELTAEWNNLSDAIPGIVSAIQTKADALAKKHRLPKSIADSFASAKQTWEEASSAFISGQLQDALAKGANAKVALTDLQTKLKIKPAS